MRASGRQTYDIYTRPSTAGASKGARLSTAARIGSQPARTMTTTSSTKPPTYSTSSSSRPQGIEGFSATSGARSRLLLSSSAQATSSTSPSYAMTAQANSPSYSSAATRPASAPRGNDALQAQQQQQQQQQRSSWADNRQSVISNNSQQRHSSSLSSSSSSRTRDDTIADDSVNAGALVVSRAEKRKVVESFLSGFVHQPVAVRGLRKQRTVVHELSQEEMLAIAERDGTANITPDAQEEEEEDDVPVQHTSLAAVAHKKENAAGPKQSAKPNSPQQQQQPSSNAITHSNKIPLPPTQQSQQQQASSSSKATTAASSSSKRGSILAKCTLLRRASTATAPPHSTSKETIEASLNGCSLEPKNSGEYVHYYPTQGHFACRRCTTPLFSAASKSRMRNAGYATFSKHFRPSVQASLLIPSLESLLHADGNPDGMSDMALAAECTETGVIAQVMLRCVKCNGFIGILSQERETDTGDYLRVNSASVEYKPQDAPDAFLCVEESFTGRNMKLFNGGSGGKQQHQPSSGPGSLFRRGSSNAQDYKNFLQEMEIDQQRDELLRYDDDDDDDDNEEARERKQRIKNWGMASKQKKVQQEQQQQRRKVTLTAAGFNQSKGPSPRQRLGLPQPSSSQPTADVPRRVSRQELRMRELLDIGSDYDSRDGGSDSSDNEG